MKRVFFTAIVFLLFFVSSRQAWGQIKEIPYTIDDRDRLIRVEEQIKALQNEMNTRFEAMQKEMNIRFEAMDDKFEAIDDKINKLYTLMYFVLGGVFGLIGFVIYDRKTALAPVARDNRRIKEILYELAKTNPELKEILRNAAL